MNLVDNIFLDECVLEDPFTSHHEEYFQEAYDPSTKDAKVFF